MKKGMLGFLGILIICGGASATVDTELYSRSADEYNVAFNAEIRTNWSSLQEVKDLTSWQKKSFEDFVLKATVKYIFGPLTNRSLGGEQKGSVTSLQWSQATIKEGSIFIPYEYTGQWLLNKKALTNGPLTLPLPLDLAGLKTPNWKNCTDSEPEHQDDSWFWYFWDPARLGCDHKEGEQFQMITPTLVKKTEQTVVSYPEYKSMIADKVVKMTFAFGYVTEPYPPQPFTDSDAGMDQFRNFLAMVRTATGVYNARQSEITENAYLSSEGGSNRVGMRYEFDKNGIHFDIKVVAAAGIDQMELFTKSFAHDHDDFFGWFGHSRVGNGFDADRFSILTGQNKSFYSMTPNYQLIYWAGCNSYSYYTKPFFDFKANLLAGDVKGTKSLDIISNGLPSYFSLNAANAKVLLSAIISYERNTTYQEIVGRIEQQSNASGIYVLANVLGDEDN
jgi:hypothetical protein